MGNVLWLEVTSDRYQIKISDASDEALSAYSDYFTIISASTPFDFELSSNAGDPDDDGLFTLTWMMSPGADNYSAYQYSDYINEINDSLSLLIEDTPYRTLPLSGYSNGSYYFIVVAHNEHGNTLSNCIEINVELFQLPSNFILSSNAADPDDDGLFDLTWTVLLGADNYSACQYSTYISEVNESVTILLEGTTDTLLSLSDYLDGTYYFLVVARDEHGDTLSNCIKISVEIPKFLILSLPNISSSWKINTPQQISWTSTGAISGIKIELYMNGIFVMEITSETFNDGKHDWVVFSGLVSSIQYQIKISDSSNSLISDFSNYFEIKGVSSTEPLAIPGYMVPLLFVAIGIIVLFSVRKKCKERNKL